MRKIIKFQCKESVLIRSKDGSCVGFLHEDDKDDVLVCHLATSVSVIVRGFTFIIEPSVFRDTILPNIEEV